MRAGIDIGGTKAVVALVDESMHIICRSQIATGVNIHVEMVISQLVKELETLLSKVGLKIADLSAVGIGVPGTVDPSDQIVLNAPNLGWHNQDIGRMFMSACGIRATLLQDTRAAALAESKSPVAIGKRCVVCVTLGTGIGCGIIIDGHVYHGALGSAGEIGHIPVVVNDRLCACGRRGCMEAYASGTGITRTARELGIADTCEDLFHLAEKGNVDALSIISQAVEYAAVGISAMLNVLSPDALLFSGGMSLQTQYYLDPLIARLRVMAYSEAVSDALYIGQAYFGADAPVIGAAINER